MTLREQAADRISGGMISQLTEDTEALNETVQAIAGDNNELRESVARLESALQNWERLSYTSKDEFTREGIRIIVDQARLMRLKNPIIGRGVAIQKLYVWAGGVSVTAVDETINEVVQAFLEDERNRAELTNHQAYSDQEVKLQEAGNIFFRFFINTETGRVRVRTIDPQEIEQIVTNPEDSKEPWFYRRIWTQQQLSGEQKTYTEYYPDFRFIPRQPAVIAGQLPPEGGAVKWETPVYHVAVNQMGNWGISELYAAIDWALAYKNFLEQLASVWSALARWAAKLTVKGGARGVSAARTKLNTTAGGSSGEGNPPALTGSTFIQSDGVDLQPFRTAGATMSAEDGRRLLLQAVAVFGFPETFFGDVSVGTLATAKSLDRPTELKIQDRQALWKSIINDILNYVLYWAVKAPSGPLSSMGKIERMPDAEEYTEWIEWKEGTEPTIKVEFPPIVEEDVPALVAATIDAITLKGDGGGVPKETGVRHLLSLLGFANVDEVMELWQEEEEERAAKADELAQQFSQNGQGAPEGEQEPEEETEADRVLIRVYQLLDELSEAVTDG